MRKLLQMYLTIALTLGIASLTSAAEVDPTLKIDLQKACKDKIGKSGSDGDNAAKLCECIANRHYEAALREPVTTDAASQMKWLLKYYQAKTTKERKKLSAGHEAMVEFDFSVAEECVSE